MNPDGISYLDIARLYSRGEWQAAVIAYWSPLYCWLLGAVFAFAPPGPRFEFQVVHLVNFGIFVGALACYERLMAAVVGVWRGRAPDSASVQEATIQRWWLLAGYAAFSWVTLRLITLTLVNPDLLAFAVVLAVATLLIRVTTNGGDWRTAMALGALLGLAYLAKAVMFGVALVTLSCLPWALARGRRARPTTLAVLSFTAVALPFVIAISSAKGRPTIGDAGRLNLLWQVNRQWPPYAHWQGDQFGVATHPTRLVHERPTVFEFAAPIPGTYPVWLDPSYSFEGARPRFARAEIGRVVLRHAGEYGALMAPLLVAFAVLVGLRGPPYFPKVLTDLRSYWPALAMAAAGHAACSLILVEGRYVGPFIFLWSVIPLVALSGRDPTAAPGRAIAGCSVGLAPAFTLPCRAGHRARY